MEVKNLIKKNAVAGAFAASFIHSSTRFMAGKKAGNSLESKLFEKFNGLSPKSKDLMQRTTKSFDSLSAKRKGAFAVNLTKGSDKPADADVLGKAFSNELTSIVSELALDTKMSAEFPVLRERPGKVRLYKYNSGGDVYPHQIHIFKINELRTYDHVPKLGKGDYLPEEFQNVCTPREDGGIVKWDCKVKRAPCDGHSIDDICLRVQQVQPGASVTLIGVNFFDINARIFFRRKGSSAGFKKIKAFVYGDIDTPVKKTVNGKRVLIADSRVKDKIFFSFPSDTASGFYEFKVAVPNTTEFTGAGFGDTLFSPEQYIEVVPLSNARFQVASEHLYAKDETWGTDWGHDKVGIKINAIPFYQNLTMGAMQQHSFRFDDVDTRETHPMESILFSHTLPIAGVILSVIGHEVDNEGEYSEQVNEWTDIFVDLVKEQLDFIMANSQAAKDIIKQLSAQGLWGYVVIGAAVLVTLAIDFIYSLWAGADLIIQDTMAFSLSDLGRMTSINYPSPNANPNTTLYTTGDGDIQVRLMSNDKIPNEYTEERGYKSSDNKSWYNIRLRYNRLT
jgi:hypothetical protein